MKIFSTESPLYKFVTRLWDILVLNFFWLVCSLPLVTFGPATVAAFTVMLRMADDTEGYVVKPFFRAFRDNFKIACPMGILHLICIFGIVVDFFMAQYGAELGINYPILFIIMGVLATFIVWGCFLYVYPLIARYENRFVIYLKNSGRISSMFFGRTLVLTILVALEVVIFLWNGYTLIIGALLGPGIVMMTISGFALKIFKRIERDGGATRKKTEEDLYNEQIERETEEALKKEKMGKRF